MIHPLGFDGKRRFYVISGDEEGWRAPPRLVSMLKGGSGARPDGKDPR